MVRSIGIAAVMLTTAACGSKRHDPFVVQPEELVGKLQRLALSPVTVPDGLPIADSTIEHLHTIIASHLDSAGFGLVEPDGVSRIWEPLLDEVGGFYDPRTGRVMEEKRAAVTTRFTTELRDLHGVDAIVYPELLLVEAPYSDGSARWDGTSQSVAGFWAKFAEAVSAVADAIAHEPHVSGLPVGTVTAVTLQIVIEDLDGNELYTNWGGVEVIADDQTGEWLDPSVTFQDTERFERAVEIAVKQFSEQVGARRGTTGAL